MNSRQTAPSHPTQRGASDPAAPRRNMRMVDAIGLLLCVLSAGAFYLLSVEPLREARVQRNALFAELEPRLEKVGHLENNLRSQQGQLKSIGDQIAEGQLQLRTVDQINHRLSELTSTAAAFELKLEEVRPGDAGATQWFMTMPIRLSGRGEYPDIGAFLHALPSRFPDVAVVGLEIRGEPEQIEREPRFVLSLVWYAAPRSQSSAN